MKKKILIIGFGSIGKRHASIIKKLNLQTNIFIFSSRNIKLFKNIRKLSNIRKIDPDYIIICSKTSDHYNHLKYIEKNLAKKIILVEKPLFHKVKKLKILKNKVFIGYNLRQHPVLQYIKKFIKNKKVFSVDIACHSYLPSWRKNINYKKSYSAQRNLGGGVLLDLSHELDYLTWIFKNVTKIHSVSVKKLSNLEINSEDYAFISGKTKLSNFTVSLNYFSLNPKREIIVDGKNFSIKADLINNSIEILNINKKKKLITFKNNKNYTYIAQHKLLLNNNFSQVCTFNEGKKLMTLIDKIKKFKK